LGLHDGADAVRYVPAVFARGANRTYDMSGMGYGDDPDFIIPGATGGREQGSADADGDAASGGPIPLRSLSQRRFREKLIEHFTILYSQKKIVWPSRTGAVEWQPFF
jgi:hypothetical protein